MSYTPRTDFLAIIRQTMGGARVASMPGVDWVVAALARIGMVTLWTNPDTAPTVNPSTTVWLKTSAQSWATEGAVMLWNSDVTAFVPATPVLWSRLLGATIGAAREVDPSASMTLTADDAGQLFTNRANATIEYTLPVAISVDGAVFEFLTTQNGLMTLALVSGDVLNWGDNQAAFTIQAADIGAVLKVRSVNGQWFVMSGDGEWLLQ